MVDVVKRRERERDEKDENEMRSIQNRVKQCKVTVTVITSLSNGVHIRAT